MPAAPTANNQDAKRSYPPRAAQRAARKLRRMQERLDEVHFSQSFLDSLLETCVDQAAWPTDIRELADKIERQRAGGLRSFEAPVRDKDRQLVKAGLPPGIQVNMDDVRYN